MVVDVEKDSNDSVGISVVLVFHLIFWLVHKMEFEVKSLAVDGVFGLRVPMELNCLPSVCSFSVVVRVP